MPTGKREDLSGREFNGVKVIARKERRGCHVYYTCLCVCGNEFTAEAGNLRSGHTTSCRCLMRTQGGLFNKRIYNIWGGMMGRCYRPTARSYKYYGARGIRVCDRWHSAENFYADVGEPPEGSTLDRIDNGRDYGPDNWRWATRKQQARNTRSNTILYYMGKSQCLADWADEFEMSQSLLGGRIARGWSVDRALTEPRNGPPIVRPASLPRGKGKLLEFDGERHSAAEWSRRLSISYGALRARLDIGWSVYRALSTPVRSHMFHG